MKGEEQNKAPRTSLAKSDEVPDELRDILKGISLPGNATIYEANENYPDDSQIIRSGIAISWKEVIEQANNLHSYQDIQKALKTSIGAYRTVFQREDLSGSIQTYLEIQKVWPPKEDVINALTKKKLLEAFRLLHLNKIINDDFKEEKTPIDIEEMSESEYCQAINSSLIYSVNKEIMIAQDRDTFFCLLLSRTKEDMNKILAHIDLEGFLCDEKTALPWEFEDKELAALLKKEKEQESKPIKWWPSIFKK
jgi:hypothetical protein